MTDAAGRAKALRPTDVKRLNREWRRRTEGRVSLLLDGVQQPFNVGAIVRTSAALRVEHLYLSGGSASPALPKVGKVSLGTERYRTWSEHESGEEALDAVKDDGHRLIAVELASGAVPLHEVPLGPSVCLAVGHEDHGLSALTLAAADAVAFVPQLGRVGSLNVATATSIALYEVRRRAWT